MKVSFKEKEEATAPPKYPMLKIWRSKASDSHQVVLFTAENTGYLVSGESDAPFTYHSKDWQEESHYKPFRGELTITVE